jgi:hypothetical protein
LPSSEEYHYWITQNRVNPAIQDMNTQNNEQDRLVDLLAATSQGGDSHKLRMHLQNRLGDQEVLDAVIDYASALTQARSRLGNDVNFGNETFTSGKEITPHFNLERLGTYGDSPFADGKE